MPSSCCAYGCTNRSLKDSSISFFRIPKVDDLRTRWIRAINRDRWLPNEHTRLCGDHFIKGYPSKDPSDPDCVPSLFAPSKESSKKRKKRSHLKVSQKRFPKKLKTDVAQDLVSLQDAHCIKQEQQPESLQDFPPPAPVLPSPAPVHPPQAPVHPRHAPVLPPPALVLPPPALVHPPPALVHPPSAPVHHRPAPKRHSHNLAQEQPQTVYKVYTIKPENKPEPPKQISKPAFPVWFVVNHGEASCLNVNPKKCVNAATNTEPYMNTEPYIKTEPHMETEPCTKYSTKSSATQTTYVFEEDMYSEFNFESISQDEYLFKSYTGMTLDDFMELLNCLSDDDENSNHKKRSPSEKLFMTLVKLRQV